MITLEAVILAGGFGTRLRHIVQDVPKPMAPVAGKPFLSFILDDLNGKGVTHAVMAVGYKRESIISYYQSSYAGIRIDYSTEDRPLGTGGAIKKALEVCQDEYVLVINGDTFFDADLSALIENSDDLQADVVIASKRMQNFSRYGALKLEENNRIAAFMEKESCREGLINGGIYLLRTNLLKHCPEVFSFEEFLQSNIQTLKVFALECEGYFIDIGIPDDYAKAQDDFQHKEALR